MWTKRRIVFFSSDRLLIITVYLNVPRNTFKLFAFISNISASYRTDIVRTVL